LEDGKFLPRDSASESVCMTGVIKPKTVMKFGFPKGVQVFIKMTRQYETQDKFKEIEPRLYRDVVNQLIQHRLTPHVMMYLGSERVSNWYKSFRRLAPTIPVVRSIRDKFIQAFGPTLPDRRKGGDLLVTECGRGIKFSTFMEKYVSDPEHTQELTKILFQIFYTLVVMDHRKITHYDLHLGNIFLEELVIGGTQPSQTFVYFLDDHTYVTLTLGKYFVRLYDWDMAYEEKTINESERRSRRIWACPNYGMCNVHKSEYDSHKVLMLVDRYRHVIPPRLAHFIQSQYGHSDQPDLNWNLYKRQKICNDHNCRSDSLCQLKTTQNPATLDTTVKCNGEWKPIPHAIVPVPTLLRTMVQHLQAPSTFQLHTLPDFDPHYLPGTFKWINYVFSPTTDTLLHAQQNITHNYKTHTLQPIRFKK
jgi:hypothetical protein